MNHRLTDPRTDREEALRDDFHFDSTYDYGEDEEWADEDVNWSGEDTSAIEPQEAASTVKDESAAYLEFLNDEVRHGSDKMKPVYFADQDQQAAKFSRALGEEDEGDLGEDNFLDSPLDKVEPYQLFKSVMISKCAPARAGRRNVFVCANPVLQDCNKSSRSTTLLSRPSCLLTSRA